MSINKLNNELDELKKQYHHFKGEIEKKRQEIAEHLCPFNIGDEITITRGTKTIKGVIDDIHSYIDILDLTMNEIGAETTWQVSGKRIKKTTGILGKWSFSVNPIFYDINGNIFTAKNIDLTLGTYNDINP